MNKRDIARLNRRALALHEQDLMETLVNSLTASEQAAVVSIVCNDEEARVTLKDGRTWTLTNHEDGWMADDT